VGVNRLPLRAVLGLLGIPHTRGGEPIAEPVISVRHRRIPHTRGGEPLCGPEERTSLVYSPHAWG